MALQPIDELKLILREKDVPFFEDEELNYHLSQNGNKVGPAAYRCLIIKSESSNMTLPGLTLPDTSKYFRRLAVRYRPRHSGVLGGGGPR